MPTWATDRLAKVSDVVVVEITQLSNRVDTLNVDDVVVGTVVESDATLHDPELLVGSHDVA